MLAANAMVHASNIQRSEGKMDSAIYITYIK